MAGLHLEKGAVIDIKGRRYTCGGRGPGGSYLFAPHKGRSSRYLKPEALFDQLQKGDVTLVEDTEYFGEDLPAAQFDLSALKKDEQRRVLERLFYMEQLTVYRNEGGTLSNAALDDFSQRSYSALVKKCRKKDREPPSKPMSAAAIRRWFRSWSKSGFQLISLVREARGNSHSKLTSEQEQFLAAAIDEDFLNTGRLTARKVHTLMKAKINVENRARKVDGRAPIQVPHYNTLLAHINRLDLFDKLKARFNAQYALKVTRQYGITPPVNRHLERVQADHTQVDTYVDFGNNILFRPWLTLLLDSYSKAVLGFWLTPDPPSSESVMQALRIALLPKDLEALGGDASWPWMMDGFSSELTLDNGKEFHGNDLEIAAAELGITLSWTPPRKPYYKAQVERKFGEINRSLLAGLPGQVFKYEPEKHGIDYPHLSLDEFKRIFLQWITTELHRRPNKEGYTPEELWHESVHKYGTPGSGLSLDYVAMCLSKSSSKKKIVHPNGIHFNNLTFNNEWLSRLRNELAPKIGDGKPTVKIKWSASDVGLVWVLDPNAHQYFPVHSKEEYAHGRSLYNHRVILREQRHRREAKMSDDSYLDAVLAVDQAVKNIVDSKKTKKRSLGTKIVRYETGKPDSQGLEVPVQPEPHRLDETIQQQSDDLIDATTGETLNTDFGTTQVAKAMTDSQLEDIEYFPEDLEI